MTTKIRISSPARTLMLIIAAAVAPRLIAQERVPSIVEQQHDPAWYKQQITLWEARVADTPADENAWRNLFAATRYATFEESPNDQSARTKAMNVVLSRMESAIPNSFTYHLCAFQAANSKEHGDAALALMPDTIEAYDRGTLLGYLWQSGDADDTLCDHHQYWKQLLAKQYDETAYPESILRFAYNAFLGMDKNAIYIGNGDMGLFPMVLLQEVLGIQRDKQVIAFPFMILQDYMAALYKRLGIPFYTPEKRYFTRPEDYEEYYAGAILHIAEQTGRPIYFFGDTSYIPKRLLPDLYREGLLLRYSPKRYDNTAATKNLVENRYHLEYLTEPAFTPRTWWEGSRDIQMAYVVMLAPIVKSYMDEGNKQRARWLNNILRQAVHNTPLSDEALMPLILMRDERAFDELYARYAATVNGFFFRRTGATRRCPRTSHRMFFSLFGVRRPTTNPHSVCDRGCSLSRTTCSTTTTNILTSGSKYRTTSHRAPRRKPSTTQPSALTGRHLPMPCSSPSANCPKPNNCSSTSDLQRTSQFPT